MAHRKADHDIILSSYDQGMSVPDISAAYGISDNRIYYVLKLHGITLRPRRGVGKVLNQEQEAEIVALYQAGMSGMQLATRYGIESTTIYTTLEQYGIARRTNSDIFRKLSPAQEDEVIALYQQGLPASQITSRYPINDQTVYNILERHGVTR